MGVYGGRAFTGLGGSGGSGTQKTTYSKERFTERKWGISVSERPVSTHGPHGRP